eukprot:TRINITY_DN35005_c0_g1_i1.p1 TRINITY_DN35005_c0_g1~~TRINITY_DN35005_c0_g1_i1.p1  ORF type:complete len:113 (+),score=13.92 TRINITY_DN35005_c0_g1_i1:28-339(+)
MPAAVLGSQVRHLSRAQCLGRTARNIIATDKLERVLRRHKPQRGGRPAPEATRSKSFLQLFPRELLDHSFEAIEEEARHDSRKGHRAKEALRWLLSPAFDKPR